MPATAQRPTGRTTRRQVVRTLARGLLVTALGLTGAVAGVASTATLPTTVSAGQFAATVRLTADPAYSSTVHVPTVFGDLDARFGRVPAPGVEANLQVEESIASVLATSGVDFRRLAPSQQQITQAVSSALWQVAAKVLLGVALVAVVAWALLRALGWSTWPAPVAAVLSVLLVAAPMALAYRGGRVEELRTTGLLSLVRANRSMLGDVEQRAAQATPYVRNMLALASALQERYTPSTIDAGSLRVVAVSDIHGANQYPLLKALVQEEKAHFVVDSGDLVNFGSVREAQAAGLFAGIESLGVPYVFVRGNHDADSPTDDALVQRLRRIPNVVVLEPRRERQYTLASIGGLTVAGFGDPRWFGDGGRNTAEAQKPAIAAFERAATALRDGTATTTYDGDRAQPFDLLVGHEPAAVQGLAALARVRLNGHLHAQSLDGSRIALGSFTGGGVVSHYIQSSDGSELAGQPYAFDVLAFGAGCELASLTRYQFTDLLEGRPTYDRVQVLNGAAIESQRPAAGRTCSPDLPTRTWTFEAPADAEPQGTPTATPSVTPSLPSGSPTPTVTETRTPAAPAAPAAPASSSAPAAGSPSGPSSVRPRPAAG